MDIKSPTEVHTTGEDGVRVEISMPGSGNVWIEVHGTQPGDEDWQVARVPLKEWERMLSVLGYIKIRRDLNENN